MGDLVSYKRLMECTEFDFGEISGCAQRKLKDAACNSPPSS